MRHLDWGPEVLHIYTHIHTQVCILRCAHVQSHVHTHTHTQTCSFIKPVLSPLIGATREAAGHHRRTIGPGTWLCS